MSETFVVSDTHFGHASTFEKFKNPDGTPLRPFTSVEEMNETMVERWNKVVGPEDRVLHLGDVVINKKFIPIMDRLNGVKDLIIGNHDEHYLERLAPYFRSMNALKVKGDLIFTHIPIHPDSVERFGCNVHGHLHGGRVMQRFPSSYEYYDNNNRLQSEDNSVERIDPRYLNVSCEHTNFQPIPLDEVRDRIKKQQEAAGYDPKAAWGNGSSPS